MKLIIFAAIVALTFGAAIDASFAAGKWAGSVQKFDGTFTCQMTMTISGHTEGSSKTAPSGTTATDPIYLVAAEKQAGAALANDEKIFGCTVSNAAVGGKWKFTGATKGSCSNYTITALKPASPKLWTDSLYDFNCTTTNAAGADDLNDTICKLSFDQGKLNMVAYADIKKTGVQIIMAGNTLAANWVAASATLDATVTEVTDKKCEDASSAVSTMFAGAFALAGAAFF